jgi:hypothetical protein
MAKRKIPCPYCTGEVLAEKNGRASTSASLFPRLQNVLSALSDFVSALTLGTVTISRKEAIGGDCKACKNKGTIEDPTDTTDVDKQRADFLVRMNATIEKYLGRLGRSPGGSRITRIAGNEVVVVGHKLNTAKSYRTKKDVAGPGNKIVDSKGKGRAAVDAGSTEHRAVVGNNVPANSGGGAYIIQCGNRFNLMAGSQGISLKTTGPIEIHGGIVNFTGADMTFGTNVGQTSIAGNHVVVQGKNVSMKATGESGQIGIEGSLGITGNLQSGGAYVDNMYCAKMTMPSKTSSTKGGANTRFTTGPASWGVTGNALINSLADFQNFITERTLDMNLFGQGGPTTPRFQFNLGDAITDLVYTALPVELKVTGICLTPVGPGVIFNFPHTHILPDGLHTHDVRGPAIACDNHSSAESVKAAFANSGGNTQIAAASEGGEKVGLLQALAGIPAAGRTLLASARTLLGSSAA